MQSQRKHIACVIPVKDPETSKNHEQNDKARKESV